MPFTPNQQLNAAMPAAQPFDLSNRSRELLQAFPAECEGDPVRFANLIQKDAAFISAALSAAAPTPTDGVPYSRKILFAGPAGEAMVAHWPAGSVSWPHDHGDAWGTVIVLAGNVIERGFSLRANLEPVGEESFYEANAAIQVRPGGIHDMRATSRSITLHFYSPQIREMKVYDQPSRTIYT
ncbi:MAG: hypothetical protein EOP11_24045, partial [Proteobacteria bacterium]